MAGPRQTRRRTPLRAVPLDDAATSALPPKDATVAVARAESDARRRAIEDAYEKVPDIGKAWRWYDIPYRVLDWQMRGWRRKLWPRRALEHFNEWINYLLPFNEHDRNQLPECDGYGFDFAVSADEHVRVSTLWAVELFPPSEIASLEATIERNKWGRRRHRLMGDPSSLEMLARSRSRSGATWWRLADIVGLDSKLFVPDGSRERLPPEFDYVELKAVQLGEGLTAVVARFMVTENASLAVDRTWHTPHAPRLVRGHGRPRAEDREWAGYAMTQESRNRLHEAARTWLRERVPGFFASTDEPQRLLDLMLMDQFDPSKGEEGDREVAASFRALGLTEHGPFVRRSANLPNLVLVPNRPSMSRGLPSHRTMALWGQRAAVLDAADHVEMYGGRTDRAIAARYNDEIQNFLITIAVSDFIEIVEKRFASLRDTARRTHGEFRTDALETLRRHLLTLSLDLASVRGDLETWRQRAQREGEAEFTIEYTPRVKKQLQSARVKNLKPESLNANLRKTQEADFERLLAADAQYRDILSTVASLGASMNASILAKRALVIALASLVATVVTVLVATFDDDSVLGRLLDLLP